MVGKGLEHRSGEEQLRDPGVFVLEEAQQELELPTCCWEFSSVSRYLVTWFLKSLDFSFCKRWVHE